MEKSFLFHCTTKFFKVLLLILWRSFLVILLPAIPILLLIIIYGSAALTNPFVSTGIFLLSFAFMLTIPGAVIRAIYSLMPKLMRFIIIFLWIISLILAYNYNFLLRIDPELFKHPIGFWLVIVWGVWVWHPFLAIISFILPFAPYLSLGMVNEIAKADDIYNDIQSDYLRGFDRRVHESFDEYYSRNWKRYFSRS
jgi:hypothetical protein